MKKVVYWKHMKETLKSTSTAWPIIGIVGILVAGAAVWYLTSDVSSPAEQPAPLPPAVATDGQVMTLEGTVACLPHADSEGPQTLECAIGLQTGETYYGLDKLSSDALTTYRAGSIIRVTGIYQPAPENSVYAISGTIEVTEIASIGDAGEETGSPTYDNADYGFSFIYTTDFNVLSEEENARLPWSQDSSLPGRRLVTLSLPQDFMPKTNFSEATVSAGVSNNAGVIADCITGEQGTMESKRTINGLEFTVLSLTDAGAGNRYATKSYRLLRDKTCYAFEATIHSTAVENHPAEQGIAQFDAAKIDAILEAVISTIAFK